MDWEIVRYSHEMAARWDGFVDTSRNGTFLLRRNYMDYHSDRFDDCSWLAFKGSRLMALLPANRNGDLLQSHGGLTYGGWLLPPAHLDGADLLNIFAVAIRVWKSLGIKRLDYKTIPGFYAKQPSHEDEYALFRLGATLSERNLSATIDLRSPGGLNTLQRRHLKQAVQLPIRVTETHDIDGFMAMLADCLAQRHEARPVHSAAEMKMLAGRFPDNIRFFVTEFEQAPQAGVCIYDTGIAAHAQYIATTPCGRELNLLTPLFHHLITETFAERRFFDFGTSNENRGLYLNAGLLRQKYSYGATGTVYSRYSLDLTKDFSLLSDQ